MFGLTTPSLKKYIPSNLLCLQTTASFLYFITLWIFLSFTKVSPLTIHYRDTVFTKITDGFLINPFSSLISIFSLLDLPGKSSCRPLPSWNSFFVWFPQNNFLILLIISWLLFSLLHWSLLLDVFIIFFTKILPHSK